MVLSYVIKKESGQSLIEVLIALSVIILATLAFTIGVTNSIKNSQFSKNQTLATKYAQEGMEKARDLRTNSPDTFWQKNGTDTENNVGTIFTRQTTYTPIIAGSKMEVVVVVSWTDSAGKHESKLDTFFTNR